MLKPLVILTLLFSMISMGEVPLKKLYTLEEMKGLSTTLSEVSPRAKEATVCIELPDGSSGSGVIVSEDGLILSAAHVTQAVDQEFEVVFEDGSRYKAIGLGVNTTSDASMGQIIPSDENPKFPFVSLSTEISIGQYVFSLGHSGGFDKERGIVLRLGRITQIENSSMVTDCTLIGGDSGGPLFDLSGNLIGIHSRVGTITSSNTHVPMSDFKKSWTELKEGKTWGDGTFANAGFLFQGMRLMQREKKIEVVEVREGTNAEAAGVQVGDALTKIHTSKVNTLKEVYALIQKEEIYEIAKDGLPIEVLRDEKTIPLTLSIDE